MRHTALYVLSGLVFVLASWAAITALGTQTSLPSELPFPAPREISNLDGLQRQLVLAITAIGLYLTAAVFLCAGAIVEAITVRPTL